MNKIVGKYDIIMVTIDTLRYDVAKKEEEKGRLPNLCNKRTWEKRHSPGTFTYAAHQAFFAGFLPSPADGNKGERLFSAYFPGSETTSSNSFVFHSSNIVQGLEKEGYETMCIGGVGFFNPNFPLGKVLPSYFKKSFWNEKISVTNKDSTKNQVEICIKELENLPKNKRSFSFINISALHQPNYFYLNDNKNDTIESHGAALRYVDKELGELFQYLKGNRTTFCIICSDHGTAYGDDGYNGHRIAHESVFNVPYMEFIIGEE